jgi:hypothetical protein
MKSLVLIALFCGFIYTVQGGAFGHSHFSVNEKIREDDCAHCAGDIAKAVADCQNEDVDLLTCIQDALGAASDCLKCICDILNAIGGGDGVCDTPPQKFKKLL